MSGSTGNSDGHRQLFEARSHWITMLSAIAAAACSSQPARLQTSTGQCRILRSQHIALQPGILPHDTGYGYQRAQHQRHTHACQSARTPAGGLDAMPGSFAGSWLRRHPDPHPDARSSGGLYSADIGMRALRDSFA